MNPDTSISPKRQRLLLAAVVSGLLLAMLDQTIVGTALPAIVRDLDGWSSYLWVVTAYLVPATVSLPVYARLSDRHGRRALLLIGMALFLLGSALSASAQDMTQLIAWRGLQGLGAGALEGLSFILVADLYAGRRSAALQGMLAGPDGPELHRRPAGRRLPRRPGRLALGLPRQPPDRHRRDGGGRARAARARSGAGSTARASTWPGSRCSPPRSGCCSSASTSTPAWTSWSDPRTGGLIAAALLAVYAFVRVERRAASPIVPLRLFADRRTAAIMLAGATGAFGLFAGVLLLPRYFQGVREVSATHSGLLIYPLLLGLVIGVNVAGALIVKRGEYRAPILGGLALAALGGLGFATFDASTPDWESLVYMGLIGLGIGPVLSGLQIAMQRTVAPAAIGAAMGTLLLLRQVGASVALAASETVYAAGLDGGSSAAAATGTAVCVIVLAGAAVAAAALVSLPRGATRIALVPAPA